MISKKSNLKNFLIKTIFFLSTFSLKKKNKFNEKNPRILIVTTTAIGDTLWATPFIKSIKEKYSKSYLSVLTSKIGFEILKNNPYLDELFFIKEPVYKSFFSTLKKIRKNKFEAILIFHASQRLILPMIALTNASIIASSHGLNKDLDFLLTHKTKSKNLHEILRRDEITKVINIKTLDFSLKYYLEKEKKYPITFTQEKKYLFVIHPGASKKEKCYPPKYFIELGRLLKNNFDCNIIITGSMKEKKLIKFISSQIEASFNYVSTSLNEFACILNKMDLLITNDTGPMHLASALNKNVAAFFGPTNPKISAPYNYKKVLVFESRNACKICIYKKCTNAICFYSINPNIVFNKIKNYFNSKKQNFISI
ncbi:MAG: Lipopolysaccharide core heptosyltransferase RfaQ [Candidatus Anoxychlamydiales bacterium]|nr:Lipopolysaccharide core heptosyltransferase RfaQ [Candidatus Anoxychlamydiales bacterium]